MKKRTLLILLISLTYTIIYSQPISDVYGLLTPIQLTDTTTEVLLKDYFMDVNRIERVEVMDAFKADLSINKKILTLTAVKNAPIFSNMDIVLRGLFFIP
jgi:hypothetical protein